MAASREDLFARFTELGIETTTKTHAPVHTVAEAKALRGAIKGAHCKCLFLKSKKGMLYLVVAQEETKIDLKALAKTLSAGRFSFGKAEALKKILGVSPGSVTPFSLINDKGAQVTVLLDESMMAQPLLNYHPLLNDATTSIKSVDLLRFIEACGHRPRLINFAALTPSN